MIQMTDKEAVSPVANLTPDEITLENLTKKVAEIERAYMSSQPNHIRTVTLGALIEYSGAVQDMPEGGMHYLRGMLPDNAMRALLESTGYGTFMRNYRKLHSTEYFKTYIQPTLSPNPTIAHKLLAATNMQDLAKAIVQLDAKYFTSVIHNQVVCDVIMEIAQEVLYDPLRKIPYNPTDDMLTVAEVAVRFIHNVDILKSYGVQDMAGCVPVLAGSIGLQHSAKLAPSFLEYTIGSSRVTRPRSQYPFGFGGSFEAAVLSIPSELADARRYKLVSILREWSKYDDIATPQQAMPHTSRPDAILIHQMELCLMYLGIERAIGVAYDINVGVIPPAIISACIYKVHPELQPVCPNHGYATLIDIPGNTY